MGRQLTAREAARAVAEGATAVLDLTGEFSEASTLLSLDYLNLAVLDLTAPTPVQLRAAIDFINAHRRAGAVFVHCKIGYSRSAAVIGCWLLDAGLAVTAIDAVAWMRVARPTLVVRAEAWRALRQFPRGSDPLPETASSTLLEART
jgi:protein phosphatase